MQIDLKDKRVLVTRGTRGIGRGAVEAFLDSGAHVAINGRTTVSTAEAIAELGKGERLIPAPGDVATASQTIGDRPRFPNYPVRDSIWLGDRGQTTIMCS